MPADPRDRFTFTGDEHVFLLLDDPLGLVRAEVEHELRAQVPDTELDAIVMHGEPRFLTVGDRTAEGDAITVSQFGMCLRATLTVGRAGAAERHELAATLTFLFALLDRPGQEQLRTFFDLGADADPAFTDEVFDERFEELRSDLR